MKVAVYGETNVGLHRDHNEDAFLILYDLDKKWQEVNNLQIDLAQSKGLFLVVADGMGGANAGEVASSIAVNKVGEKVRTLNTSLIDEPHVQRYLTSIVFDAHNSIVKKARNNDEMKGMGTTMVLGYIVNNLFYVMWAGDSRVYIYNAGRHTQLVPFSDDHSIVWGRVKNGEITAEEARLSDSSNLILNALGDSFQKPMPDFKKTKLEIGDRIILCSDGLNSMLSDTGIQQIIDYNSNTKDTCQALISAACNAGGHDNITVLVVDVIEIEPVSVDPPQKTRKVRKWFWYGLLLLAIAFVVAGIVFYSPDIAAFFKDRQKSIIHKSNQEQSTKTEILEPLENKKNDKYITDSAKLQNPSKSPKIIQEKKDISDNVSPSVNSPKDFIKRIWKLNM
jgi:serine/threonine protein phosphatase PrpC